MRQSSFRRCRVPPKIIRHTVWHRARLALGFRDVEEMRAERGVDLSNETIRR
jgi:transposase-like protein